MSNISKSTSQLEIGKRSGSLDVLAAIASALDLSVDLLLPNPT
jgi:hypothetical protein